jgi:hypothetical protein
MDTAGTRSWRMTMHATIRRLRCAPGTIAQVAERVETEYVRQLEGVDDVLSYTLVHLGGDDIGSLGVFISEEAASEANELAVAWAKDRLADLGTTPLDASDGSVLVHWTFR